VAATLGGAIMMLANMANSRPFSEGPDDREGGGGMFGLLAMAIVAPSARCSSRWRSRVAGIPGGETGARFCGKPRRWPARSGRSPAVEAAADARLPATAHMFIMSPLTGGGLMSLFSTTTRRAADRAAARHEGALPVMMEISFYREKLSESGHRVLNASIEESQRRHHYYSAGAPVHRVREEEKALFRELMDPSGSTSSGQYSVNEHLNISRSTLGSG